MQWKPFQPEKTAAEWDDLPARASDDNPFQSSAWADYKGRMGWRPHRWVTEGRDGAVLCAVQLLRKPLPFGRSLLWAPGGPMIGFPDGVGEDLGLILSKGLQQICRAHRALYARFYCLQSAAPAPLQGFSAFGRAPRRRLGSGVTVQVDLSLSEGELGPGMDRKHRYMVRRAGKNSLTWRWGSGEALLADFERLHAEMSTAKKVLSQELRDLQWLASDFRENALFLIGYLGGEAVTGCLVLLKGKGAFYWRAATARKGRELSAAYAMVPELFRRLKSAGIQRFDFGGILPGVPAAAGINHFKRGFGGLLVEYVGEWEWANPSWIRWGVNTWIAGRGQG